MFRYKCFDFLFKFTTNCSFIQVFKQILNWKFIIKKEFLGHLLFIDEG